VISPSQPSSPPVPPFNSGVEIHPQKNSSLAPTKLAACSVKHSNPDA
jgi:hypothetical protein